MIGQEQSLQKQVDQIFKTIDQYLAQKPVRKNLQADVNKELKKVKNLVINLNKDPIPEALKKSVAARQKKVKQNLEKIKPVVYITAEERAAYRQQIIGVIKQIDKKITALNEKKDNRKRQANIQFFKQHQTKLTMLADWLTSSSRKFPSQTMKKLKGYIQDLTISHDDTIFQEQLKQIYDKIIAAANEPAEVSHSQFFSSYYNRPKINDYLLTKQTKQILPRNSILPQYKMIDLSVIPKMKEQTHFFMFYFHKGEPEQYLVAKQLMKSSWRFYKKFNIWLRRNCTPTFDGPEFQTGKYVSMNSQLQIKDRDKIKVYHNALLKTL